MTKNNGPTVSVGLPVYNGENYLEDAIRSLLDQTFTDFEVIICDNASEDGTEDICRTFAAQDERVRYERNSVNLGANPNYNKTFALAKGDFFRWHAHDDVCDPKYLELCMIALEDDPSAVIAHTRTVYIDRNGDPLVELENGFLDPDGFIEKLHMDDAATNLLSSDAVERRFGAVVNHMTVFFDIFGLARSEAVRRTLLLQPYYGADKVFLAELALMGRLARVDEGAFRRRCHRETSSRAKSLSSLASWSQSGRLLDYYPALMIAGYARAIRTSDLTNEEKRRCLGQLALKARSPYKLLRGR